MIMKRVMYHIERRVGNGKWFAVLGPGVGPIQDLSQIRSLAREARERHEVENGERVYYRIAQTTTITEVAYVPVNP